MWRGSKGIHRYEFCESYDLPRDLGELSEVLRERDYICNFFRASRLLGREKPLEILDGESQGICFI